MTVLYKYKYILYFRSSLVKLPTIKFHENPFTGSSVV